MPRIVCLEGCTNFRDLGGYHTADGRRVRHGLVFRSAHLGGLTQADRQVIAGLGVRTVVDLRGLSEAAETPHALEGLGAEIMALFARLHESGNTIVLVTHEADVAAYAHRTLHLRDGQVEKDVRERVAVSS